MRLRFQDKRIFTVLITLSLIGSLTVSGRQIQPRRSQKTSVDDISSTGYIADKPSSVLISGVTLGLFDEIEPVGMSDGYSVYQVVSDRLITPINIQLAVTGFTEWELGNQSIPYLNNSVNFGKTTTIGALYLIVDGFIQVLLDNVFTSIGTQVGVQQGDHTITVVYLNYNPQTGIDIAYDTVVIRVRKSTQEFNDYSINKVELNLNVEDLFEEGQVEYDIITDEEYKSSEWDRQKLITPYQKINSIVYNNGSDINLIPSSLSYLELNNQTSVKIDATVNSSGIADLQIQNTFDSAEGMTFFLDATGLHPLPLDQISLREGYNFIGILTFAPYGMMNKYIPCNYTGMTSCVPEAGSFVDWEFAYDFFLSTQNSSGDQVFFDSSFDFVQSISGVELVIQIEDRERLISTVIETPVSPFPILITLTTYLAFRRRRYSI